MPNAPAPLPQHPPGRITGLTVWRVLLMLGGLPLHAILGYPDYPPFAAIALVSESFRMPVSLVPMIASLPSILGHAPIFLLGFFAARSPTLWRMLTAGRLVPAVILALALAAHLILRSPWLTVIDADRWTCAADMVALVGDAWCPAAATVLILRSAMAIRRVPRLLDRLADASFTIYVLHYPIIVATKILILPPGWGVWPDFTLSILTGGGLSYAIHRWIVAPSPLLGLLIAGRSMPRPVSDAPVPATIAAPSAMGGVTLLSPGAPRR